jgi:hypothetical protein
MGLTTILTTIWVCPPKYTPNLELSIRGERENRKIGYAVFYEDLVYQFVRDRPRRYWQAQAAPASGRRLSRVLGARGLRDGAIPRGKDLIVSSRSVCYAWERPPMSA